MRKVIVNSTPIIALYKAGELDVLKKLYGEITVPAAVFSEVIQKNDGIRAKIEASPWIRIERVNTPRNARIYRAKLHEGEVEVMLLAQEYEGEHLVVIDDNAARKTAVFLGLKLTGTLGVLLKAKALGHIASVMPAVEQMERNGIYFSKDLKDRIRRLSDE